MQFFTLEESKNIMSRFQIDPYSYRSLQTSDKKPYQYKYPKAQDLFYYSYLIAQTSIEDEWAFLFISNDSVFSSGANTYLYYSLRKHNGDYRLIENAPGHMFVKHEVHDLASFISICISNSYDALLLNFYDYSRFSFSHDGFLDFYTNDDSFSKQFEEYIQKIEKA